jgi:Sec-independent protein translocase protein TatA
MKRSQAGNLFWLPAPSQKETFPMMLSAGKIALIAVILVLLLKHKDIPKFFGDLGQGITNFKNGLAGLTSPSSSL